MHFRSGLAGRAGARAPPGAPPPRIGQARAYPRGVRRIVAITGSIVFLDAMLFGAIIPVPPRFADDYDLTKLGAGVLLGAYGGGALVGGIPGGFLVGKVGPKRGVLLGLAVLSLSSIAFALAGRGACPRRRAVRPGLLERNHLGRGARLGRGQRSRERRGQALGTASAWPCSASSSARCSAASRTRSASVPRSCWSGS